MFITRESKKKKKRKRGREESLSCVVVDNANKAASWGGFCVCLWKGGGLGHWGEVGWTTDKIVGVEHKTQLDE